MTDIRAELAALRDRWRAEGARKDLHHATMVIGWKICADELDALIARLPPAETGWQPIATAPKDGTRFVGGCHHKIYGWIWASCQFYQDDKYGMREPYAVMDGGGEPTYWMPIPAPPSADTLSRSPAKEQE